MNHKKMRVFSIFDKIFALCALVLVLCLLSIPFLDRNNRALFYFFQKKYALAEQKWLSALSEKAFSPFYRMNLALNYMLSNRPEKSLKEYESLRALIKKTPFSSSAGSFFKKKKILYRNKKNLEQEKRQKQTPLEQDILFYSFFNSAVSSLKKGELEQALRFYQKALSFRPHSVEVKTNIELLTAPIRQSNQEKEKKKKNNKPEQKNNKQQGNEDDKKEGNKQQGNKEGNEDDKKEGNKQQGKKEKSPSRKNSDKKKLHQEKDQQAGDGSLESKNKSESSKPDSQQQAPSSGRGRQKMSDRQTEAILKAILNQENEIRKRRQKARNKPSNIKKDW